MGDQRNPGVYLIVEFDWPRPVTAEHGNAARALHTALNGQDWIREVLAASGGIGGGPSSVWVFWLESYAALDRLSRRSDDSVAATYHEFFTQMARVQDRVREEVVFLED